MKYGLNRAFAECEACGHPRMAHFGGGCHCGCRGAVSFGSETEGDLVGILKRRVVEVSRPAGTPTWELISQAARLRREGAADRGIEVSRRARTVAESLDEETAAASVEVAALCDLGRDEEARRVGEAALLCQESPFLLKALGRAWWLGFTATHGIEEFRARVRSALSWLRP